MQNLRIYFPKNYFNIILPSLLGLKNLFIKLSSTILAILMAGKALEPSTSLHNATSHKTDIVFTINIFTNLNVTYKKWLWYVGLDYKNYLHVYVKLRLGKNGLAIMTNRFFLAPPEWVYLQVTVYDIRWLH